MSLSNSPTLQDNSCSVIRSIQGLYGSSFSLWFYYNFQKNPLQSYAILTADKIESQRIIKEFSALFSNRQTEDEQTEKIQSPQIVYLPAFDNLAYYGEVPLPNLASRMNAFEKIKANSK